MDVDHYSIGVVVLVRVPAVASSAGIHISAIQDDPEAIAESLSRCLTCSEGFQSAQPHRYWDNGHVFDFILHLFQGQIAWVGVFA